MRSLPFVSAALMAIVSLPSSVRASPVDTDHLSVELVSEHGTLVPGSTGWIGLRLRHEASWHTYWINPGDSGLPTRVTWKVPAGFKVGEIAWPVPNRFDVDGLANFGYDGDRLLPVSLTVPADAKPGSVAHVSAVAKWLVCHEECIPGSATLQLELPIASRSDSSGDEVAQFDRARAERPANGAWKANAQIVGSTIEVQIRGADIAAGEKIDAFAEQSKVVANAPPHLVVRGGVPVLIFAKSDYFDAAPAALDLVITRAIMPADASGRAPAIRVHALFSSLHPVPASS